MKKICLTIILAFLTTTVSFAQSSVSKNWNTFWTQFSSAVKSKNKTAVKRLMVSESNFLDGGGGETRDEWLNRIHKDKLWHLLQKSVAKGTIAYNEGNFTGRITNDRHLIFQYTGGKWRFAGVMGD